MTAHQLSLSKSWSSSLNGHTKVILSYFVWLFYFTFSPTRCSHYFWMAILYCKPSPAGNQHAHLISHLCTQDALGIYNSGFLMTLASHRATHTRQSTVEHHSVSSFAAAQLSLLCLSLLHLCCCASVAAAPLLLLLSLLRHCCCASVAAAPLSLLRLSLLRLSLLCLSHCWRRLNASSECDKQMRRPNVATECGKWM